MSVAFRRIQLHIYYSEPNWIYKECKAVCKEYRYSIIDEEKAGYHIRYTAISLVKPEPDF